MPTLHLLGTGAALSEPHRTTTMLAFADQGETILVDCGGDVLQRVQQAELDFDSIHGIIITHEHPDHVSGFPLFMEKLWLYKRQHPIHIYGIAPALDQARRCFAAFDTSGWTDLMPMHWHTIDEGENALVLDTEVWHIRSTPVVHSVPTIGLRVTAKSNDASVVYSCDTEPAATLERLIQPGDVLVHEANGPIRNHTSAQQAAAIAARAQASQLLLVHLPPHLDDRDLHEAQAVFPHTAWGNELGKYTLSPMQHVALSA
ncbi:MAG: MBL fold metallo-hydrolase [Rhodothermales bacterium]